MSTIQRVDRQEIEQRPPDAHQDIEIEDGVSPWVVHSQTCLCPRVLDSQGFKPFGPIRSASDINPHGVGDRSNDDGRGELKQWAGQGDQDVIEVR